jgi:DNA adenine methylase
VQKAKPLTPFLKWAGGKTWLAPRLAKMYEPFRNTHTWVEPFCGALSIPLGVMPERAILSDINPHLIELYKCIDQGLGNTVGTNFYWQNSKDCFDLIKRDFNRSIEFNSGFTMSNEWMAKAFYYLNHTCFNGLCRFNQKGEFNVGYGKYESPKLDHDFSLYQEAFRYWDFYHLGFNDSLVIACEHIRSTFIYADPPYDGGFTGYSGKFTWDDQVNLASSLAALNCPVVASNKATDRIIALYQGLGFDLQYINARRRIACNGDRTSATEILATKNL